jgi:lysyl oxidase
VCCPLGSRCIGGNCQLADLTVDQSFLGDNVFVQRKHFDAGACEIVEGCVAAPGDRTLLVFPLKSPNVGGGDLWLGAPDPSNHLFQYSSCHNHYHFTGYVSYRLLDTNHGLIAPGQKQAFCLLDTTPVLPDAPIAALYDCNNQGIQRGWADVYEVGLACQWIDITDVPPGNYILEVEINPQRVIAESSYDDNTYEVPVTISPSSCPNGCHAYDETCCRAGNPCGLTGNGSCDCANRFGWDDADCATCWFDDASCFPGFNSCPAGCTQQNGGCCDDANPCGLDDDGSCDCGGAQAWDYDDCWYCSAPDPDCPGH